MLLSYPHQVEALIKRTYDQECPVWGFLKRGNIQGEEGRKKRQRQLIYMVSPIIHISWRGLKTTYEYTSKKSENHKCPALSHTLRGLLVGNLALIIGNLALLKWESCIYLVLELASYYDFMEMTLFSLRLTGPYWLHFPSLRCHPWYELLCEVPFSS